MRNYIFLCLLWLSASVELHALDFSFSVRESGAALTDGVVNRIFKDRDGFIWLGTSSTVERYDGFLSKSYPYETHPVNYSTLVVLALAQLPDGTMYMGNAAGLWKLDNVQQKTVRLFSDKISFPVNALCAMDNGDLYIGTTNGLYLLRENTINRVTMDVENIRRSNPSILGITALSQKQLCLLTSNGLVFCHIPDKSSLPSVTKTFIGPLQANVVYSSFLRCDDRLLIGTSAGSVESFSLRDHQFRPFWSGGKFAVTSLSVENGQLAVGTSGNGLFLLNASSGEEMYRAVYHSGFDNSLSSNYISSVLLSNGILWYGTDYFLGLGILRNVYEPFRLYQLNDFKARHLSVRSSCYYEGKVYIGTREGLIVCDEQTGGVSYHRPPKGLRSNLVFSIHPYRGLIYVGTCRGGLSVMDPHSGQFVENALTKQMTRDDVFMFEEDSQGRLWIAALDGLFCWDGKTVKEYNSTNSQLPGAIVYTVCIDSSGRFWVGTDKGVALFNPAKGTFSQVRFPFGDTLNKESIRLIQEGKDGQLFFFLLDKKSLVVTDRKLRCVRKFENNTFYNMWMEAGGSYWIGGGNGLYKTDKTFRRMSFYPLDELVDGDMSVSGGALLESYKNGSFLVACSRGLVVADPRFAYKAAPFRLTALTIHGRKYAEEVQLKSDTVFHLSPDENNLTFSFASLQYETPRLMRAEYKLEGKDSVWHEVQGQHEVTYYNLPSGDYEFVVRRPCDVSSESRVRFTIRRDWSSVAWCVVGFLLACGGMTVWIRRRSIKQFVLDYLKRTVHAREAVKNYSNLSEEELRRLSEQLDNYMRKDKPYLDADFKQSDAAASLGCSVYVLSAVFSVYLKEGWYDYVNRWRIESFKAAVISGEYRRYTIQSLAERCGFKSRTSFFRIFKKITGLTPSEYIKKHP